MKILLALFFAFGVAFAKISVSVSVIPQAYFVERIAGDLVEVNIMVQKGKSPEMYEPSIKELKSLSESQLYFNIGMPFENAWMKRFQGVNPKMKIIPPLKQGELEAYLAKYGKEQTQDSSDDFHDEEHHHGDSVKHAHSHAHDSNNDSGDSHTHLPHIWLSFVLSQANANIIAESLCEIDTANCPTYKANLALLLKDIDNLWKHFKGVFGDKGGAFLVYHPAFSYIANELNLVEFAIEEDGKDAKITHTKAIFDLIKKHNIKSIFIQPQFSYKNAKIIAKEAKITLKTADPLAYDWIANITEFLNEVANDND